MPILQGFLLIMERRWQKIPRAAAKIAGQTSRSSHPFEILMDCSYIQSTPCPPNRGKAITATRYQSA
jgi:hypothetical protein